MHDSNMVILRQLIYYSANIQIIFRSASKGGCFLLLFAVSEFVVRCTPSCINGVENSNFP